MTNRSMPSCTIIPILVYPDLVQAIKWLGLMFGFNERWRVGNHRAQLSFGDGAIAISERSNKQHSAPANPKEVSLMVRVADVRKHYEHTQKGGARIIQPPADFPYGERQYSVEDIGGYIWTFSQSIADVAPEDWGGTTATKEH